MTEDDLGVILVISTPPELNQWAEYRPVKKEDIIEVITRLLNDASWWLAPSEEDDPRKTILSKIHMFKKDILKYDKFDILLSEALNKILNSTLELSLSKDITEIKYVHVVDVNASNIELKIYF